MFILDIIKWLTKYEKDISHFKKYKYHDSLEFSNISQQTINMY